LSLKGRLRFLRELFYVPPQTKNEESVWDFFARHFGEEVADTFADPFVSGIFAGDVHQLSLQAAFPTMAAAEEQSSSLIRHLIRKRKTQKVAPQIFQLQGGLSSLFQKACEVFGPEKVHLSETVLSIHPEKNRCLVKTDKGAYEAPTVYLTAPAYKASSLLKSSVPMLAEILEKIDYVPIVTLHIRVQRVATGGIFNGFGILIPSKEQRKILGALCPSSTFPSLFPDKEHHYLTVYMGGARERGILQRSDEDLQKTAMSEIQSIFKLKEAPEFLQLKRYPRAIPQYNLGYLKILDSIQQEIKSFPSLKLAGNYLGGISIPKTVTHALHLVG
ncbi:MAG: protoporphyrinogen oxidase, partial [bacterium]|nr:protoporphyrinogen oxidase [bacterium]